MANDILLFADDTGANVLTQVAYAADTQRTLGNQPGIARANFVNKVLRQTSFMSVALAQLIVDRTTQSVLDDGDDAVLLANMKNATDVAFNTNAATAKTTPVDADLLPIVDSAASNVLKKLSWLNLRATLKTYFDTLYSAIGSNSSKIQPITSSVAANALTVTLNATSLDFRSATLGDGTVNTRTIASPISMTVSSGSTLGTISATASRLVLIAIDNAGTIELAIVNLSGGNNLDETTLISTTAEGGAGAADSESIIYSTSARSNVPFRVVGFIDITEATAGTWVTAPSTIQGIGGQALAAMSSLGYGQTWQDVTGSRASGTTYTNSTGNPIIVAVEAGSAVTLSTFTINGVASTKYLVGGSYVIPPGNTYSSVPGGGLVKWMELR